MSLETLRARMAAYTSWANTPDRAARTAPARAAADARFEAEVDPDGVLAPDVRRAMAEAARRAYYARLALRSAEARAKRAPKMAARPVQRAPRATQKAPGPTVTGKIPDASTATTEGARAPRRRAAGHDAL